MKPCSYRAPYNAAFRCRHHGWLFGRCVEHFLDRFRWEGRRGDFYASADLSNLNRPYIQIDDERPRKWIAFSYGNQGSDPVVSVQLPLPSRRVGLR